MNDSTMFVCENIGVSGTTPCHVMQLADGSFEARMGFSLMGMTNFTEEDFKRCDYNPFHDEFYDNYSTGFGNTKEEAIENLKEDLKSMANSLWAF